MLHLYSLKLFSKLISLTFLSMTCSKSTMPTAQIKVFKGIGDGYANDESYRPEIMGQTELPIRAFLKDS